MKPVSVGVIGLGTVGAGTVDVLRRNGEEISRRAGREIKVTRAAFAIWRVRVTVTLQVFRLQPIRMK